MISPSEKYRAIIHEAVEKLISRALDSRHLTAVDIVPRVTKALEKYLFSHDDTAGRNEVLKFVEEIRADDLCLILSCEKGDEMAWENLVTSFDATVKSAARKMSQNTEDADDLASSIWAELYGLRPNAEGKNRGKLSYYSGRASLAGWLRAVVSQLAIDEFRKQSRFVQIEENRDFENLAEESSNNSSNDLVLHRAADPESILIDKQAASDVAAALSEAIESLEDEDRLILKLYYFDDLKLKEIAAAFGYHEATASRRVARLHSEIRKLVERSLHNRHGWNQAEVRRHLSETATNLGVDLEKLFAILVFLALLQDTGILSVQ